MFHSAKSIEKALAYLQAADPGALQKIAPLHKFLWQKIFLPSVILAADFRSNAILFGIGGFTFWQIASLIMSLYATTAGAMAAWSIFFAVFLWL